MSEALWPYLVVIVFGFLPNEVFRMEGVFLTRNVDEQSEVFRWARVMATTLLAALVCRLLIAPGPALAAIPLGIRFGALLVGIGAFFLLRRSLIGGILAGEGFFVAAAWWWEGA